jgi:hypothetical protein
MQSVLTTGGAALDVWRSGRTMDRSRLLRVSTDDTSGSREFTDKDHDFRIAV